MALKGVLIAILLIVAIHSTCANEEWAKAMKALERLSNREHCSVDIKYSTKHQHYFWNRMQVPNHDVKMKLYVRNCTLGQRPMAKCFKTAEFKINLNQTSVDILDFSQYYIERAIFYHSYMHGKRFFGSPPKTPNMPLFEKVWKEYYEARQSGKLKFRVDFQGFALKIYPGARNGTMRPLNTRWNRFLTEPRGTK